MDVKSILKVDQFVRSINVNKNSPHAILLGAGASLSSGVPSAGQCVSDWKKEIFVTNNPVTQDLVAEHSVTAVQRRIDTWLKANGHWPAEGVDDYSYFIEQCHPIAEDRQKYFAPWIRDARPHVGYQLLCILAQAQIIRSVWTTNFDSLVSKAAAATSLAPIEVGIESQNRVIRQPSTTELLCVSMHGDYRYDDLKNTEQELQAQEVVLKKALIDTLSTQSLIVMGYSGRDASVMAALEEALCRKGPTKLYWCGYSDSPNSETQKLIENIRRNDRQAFYVPSSDFDDLMIRLASVCIKDDPLKRVATPIIGSVGNSELPSRVPFGNIHDEATGLIKSNAWPLSCPSEVFAFDLVEWPKERRWKWLESLVDGTAVTAVPFRTKVLALGTIDGIKSVFGDRINGQIERVPLSETDLAKPDGSVVSLFKRAVIVAIADKLSLSTDKKFRLWEKEPQTTERRNGQSYQVFRCMEIDIRSIGSKAYLTIDPTFYVPNISEVDDLNIIDIKKRLLGYQHNNKYNSELDHWRSKLSKAQGTTEFDYPSGSGAFKFELSNSPTFAAIARIGFRKYQIPEKYQNYVQHNGYVQEDPKLLFGRKGSGLHGADKMPLRGISTCGPFDSALNLPSSDHPVRLSVVCPRAEAGILEQFLDGFEKNWQPKKKDKEDYLVPFAGFGKEFRVPIQTAKRTDTNWFTLPELSQIEVSEAASRELAKNINSAVNASMSIERSVVLVLTPERWDKFRGYENLNETFDVHDYVKAYAAQRGIATQFIKQEKLKVQDTCRFWWWFSVAIYAKAMRTPWVLDGLDENTAYVGLGYSIDRHAKKGQQIVLGCSHLYNSRGQGLEFRLTKIENPIIRNRNAFLRFEDARRIGETIRSLYWEHKRKLPERVVIHKLFPFQDEEQKGLRAGLDGIGNLDLLEINHEPNLRFVNSVVRSGQIEIDNFPVRRGTVVRLSDFEALVWVHGATDAVKESWTYFQGKRRIPGPVVIRRHAGSSQLSSLAHEVLGLSKMDWNSGDLYSPLPATVFSSKRIARIGKLLDRFNYEPFDYRLFM